MGSDNGPEVLDTLSSEQGAKGERRGGELGQNCSSWNRSKAHVIRSIADLCAILLVAGVVLSLYEATQPFFRSATSAPVEVHQRTGLRKNKDNGAETLHSSNASITVNVAASASTNGTDKGFRTPSKHTLPSMKKTISLKYCPKEYTVI
eukprot:jgi/Bigna1/73398/fgenesh1_pg.24_\